MCVRVNTFFSQRDNDSLTNFAYGYAYARIDALNSRRVDPEGLYHYALTAGELIAAINRTVAAMKGGEVPAQSVADVTENKIYSVLWSGMNKVYNSALLRKLTDANRLDLVDEYLTNYATA